nr:unnamed protein product [Digitaria exilis]
MRHPSPPQQELPTKGGEIQAALIPAGAAAAAGPAASASSAAGRGGGGGSGGSFTALLGLPTSQAMELLLPRATGAPPPPAPAPAPAPAPTFPSDPQLVDRAARFSAFASASPSPPSPPPPPAPPAGKRKPDPADRASKVERALPFPSHLFTSPRRSLITFPIALVAAAQGKSAKKGKTAEEKPAGGDGEDDKPAYVHVRARRGQATDSHSLAERARREKINARMELLKELVPGCSKVVELKCSAFQNVAVPDYSGTVWATRPYGCVARWGWEWFGFLVDHKGERHLDPPHLTGALAVVVWAECGSRFKKVSGTALVLDEIINHVQSLQRQVEYLSMRLAAVNPRVDFGGLDSFLTTERGRIAGLNCKNGIDLEQVTLSEMGVHGARHLMQLQQQFWHGDLAHPHQAASQWEKRVDGHPPVFSSSSPSLFGYDLTSSGAQQPPASKLKTEL